MPYGDRRLYGVCCAEKGTFRFRVRARGVAGHASVPGARRQRAAQARAGRSQRLGDRRARLRRHRRAARAARARSARTPTIRRRAIERAARDASRGWPRWSSRRWASRSRRRSIRASEKINVIPARAELRVDCRVPPGMGGEADDARAIREVLGDDDGVEVEFIEQVVGNRSPIESPLMDAIARLGRRAPTPAPRRSRRCCPAFTDSRWFRAAFPDCVAYGFFPQRHQTPLRDLAADPRQRRAHRRARPRASPASFFHELPRRLLA